MIYRKEEFVEDCPEDRTFPVKQVDRLTPLDGSSERYIGRAALSLQTPVGIQQIPISFDIEADSIESAFARYAEFAEPKVEELRQRIRDRVNQLQREQETRIVTPGQTGRGPRGIIDITQLKRNE